MESITLDPNSSQEKNLWRQKIEVGSQLDICVSEEVKGLEAVKDWAKGTVTEIKGNMLKVEFPDLPARYDKWINKLSFEVAPPGQKTSEDHEWRL